MLVSLRQNIVSVSTATYVGQHTLNTAIMLYLNIALTISRLMSRQQFYCTNHFQQREVTSLIYNPHLERLLLPWQHRRPYLGAIINHPCWE